MLVKRDFETPTIRLDIEANSRRSGMRWLYRVKGIAMRPASSGRVTCANNQIEERPWKDNEEKLPKGVQKITVRTSHVESGQLIASSESVRELDIVQPVLSRVSQDEGEIELQDTSVPETPNLSHNRSLTTSAPIAPLHRQIGNSIFKFLLSLISPPVIACLLSLLIALVPQLKALFVAEVPGVNMPNAPDGMPPLEWLLDIANFGGII